MSNVPPELAAAREQFLALVADLRPELHRYCARLVGSAIDGEDVVQEAFAKAFYAIAIQPELPPLRPWLFRIAHNTAIDFLRRYDRRFVEPVAQVPDQVPLDVAADPDAVRAALSSFVSLPVAQRSAVILKDVLGHSLEEIAAETSSTIAAVKAALHRGRSNLQARGQPDFVPWRDRPETTVEEKRLLARYAGLFNARDWDGLRALLLEECRLDLVGKTARRGKGAGIYFTNYAKEPDTFVRVGIAEGRSCLGVFHGDGMRPVHLVLLDWEGGLLSHIRDYRYVPYVTAELEFEPTDA
jgi:RNA polymerase sigma-70 factor (ECF subfamily)